MVANMANPLARTVESETGALDLLHPPGIAIQFRYAFGVDRQGLKVLDATSLSRVVPGANVSLEDARNICVAKICPCRGRQAGPCDRGAWTKSSQRKA